FRCHRGAALRSGVSRDLAACRHAFRAVAGGEPDVNRSLPMLERSAFPTLSLAERDRRWEITREPMRRRGLDCLVLWGWALVWDFATANARYLCPIGGNAENNTLIFPLDGEPTCYVFMPTFVESWRNAQNWVDDVRSRKGSWATCVAEHLKELRL